MKKIICGSFFLFLVFTNSCDILDQKPKQDSPTCEALNNGNGIEAAVNGIYNAMQLAYGGDFKLHATLISDIVEVNDQDKAGDLNVYRRSLFNEANNMWINGYKAINRANNVISAIEGDFNSECNVNEDDIFYQNNKDRMLGEALLARGIMHFELVRMYSPQYGKCNNAEQSGVILRLKPVEKKEGVQRATVTETYNQIIKDLKRAYKLLQS